MVAFLVLPRSRGPRVQPEHQSFRSQGASRREQAQVPGQTIGLTRVKDSSLVSSWVEPIHVRLVRQMCRR